MSSGALFFLELCVPIHYGTASYSWTKMTSILVGAQSPHLRKIGPTGAVKVN